MTTLTSKRSSLAESVCGVGARFKRVLATAGVLFAFSLPTPAVPASRPRVSKWGTYYAKTYQRFRVQGKADLDRIINEHEIEPVPAHIPLVLLVEVVIEPPKSGKKLYPSGDVDNFAKALLDLANPEPKAGRAGLWHDDEQIVGLYISKRYAEAGEAAGTLFHCVPAEDV